MKLKTVVAAMLIALAAVVIASGCKSNITPAQDTTAPAEVTELKGVAGNGKVSLSWKNPGDADLYQVEISASPAAGSLTNPVYLSAEKGMSFTAEGLSNGTAYTFTVKTIDKSLNKSTGAKKQKQQSHRLTRAIKPRLKEAVEVLEAVSPIQLLLQRYRT